LAPNIVKIIAFKRTHFSPHLSCVAALPENKLASK